jgi:hypothetical protein
LNIAAAAGWVIASSLSAVMLCLLLPMFNVSAHTIGGRAAGSCGGEATSMHPLLEGFGCLIIVLLIGIYVNGGL